MQFLFGFALMASVLLACASVLALIVRSKIPVPELSVAAVAGMATATALAVALIYLLANVGGPPESPS